MTNFKIFLRDGKLWGNEFPEIPAVSISANQDAARMRSYNRSVESACATAIEVIGIDEDALILNGFACEDDFYSVPTGWTVDIKGQYWTGPPVPEWMDIDNGMTVYEGLETRKIARLIPSKVDSPVIPEGSEKAEFDPLKPFTRDEWQAIADKHTPEGQPFHHVKGSVVVPGAWLEGEMVGYARCMVDMYYPLLNKIADKPAIDDTLKGIEAETPEQIQDELISFLEKSGLKPMEVVKGLCEYYNILLKPAAHPSRQAESEDDFLAGAEHASKEAHNKAIDQAIKALYSGSIIVMPSGGGKWVNKDHVQQQLENLKL
jgi:hypothetical protein